MCLRTYLKLFSGLPCETVLIPAQELAVDFCKAFCSRDYVFYTVKLDHIFLSAVDSNHHFIIRVYKVAQWLLTSGVS